jgi:hypothetical protein
MSSNYTHKSGLESRDYKISPASTQEAREFEFDVRISEKWGFCKSEIVSFPHLLSFLV